MKTLIFIASSFILLSSFSCQKEDFTQPSISNSNAVVGKWRLTGIFQGDVISRPCIVNTSGSDITLEITDNQSNGSNFSGQSVVNDYLGNYEAKADGTFKIKELGSTKKAGTSEMMQCEGNYFEYLRMAEGYKILSDSGKTILQLGIFKKPNSEWYDGGTYLIYERIK